jgi:hypothetical protein
MIQNVILIYFCIFFVSVLSFVHNPLKILNAPSICNFKDRTLISSSLWAKKQKKVIAEDNIEIVTPVDKTPLDTNSDEYFRAKLKAEIASPFYRIRQLLYTTMVIGGGLGTFVAVPQLILAFQNGGDVGTTSLNVAIDVGASAVGAALWIYDGKNQQKKVERFTEKELKISNKISSKEADDRASRLAVLPVEIKISEFNETITRIVPFGDLLSKGKQNAVIFAGTKTIVKDAVISARLEGSELFTSAETFVVPVVLEDDEIQLDDEVSKGFGAKEAILSPAYFGKPTQVRFCVCL